jgi:hypothetical protein
MSLFDADMCFIEDFDVLKELENYDIVSPKRIQWLSNVDINDLTIIEYIWAHCCFFNLKTITNINEINLHSIPNTNCDTGSMIVEFLFNNPHYRIKYLNLSAGFEQIPDLYNVEFFWNFKVIHFCSGSMWYKLLTGYNINDVQLRFEKFTNLVEKGLDENDMAIINKAYDEKWTNNLKRFTGIYATKDDLIRYGLNIKK